MIILPERRGYVKELNAISSHYIPMIFRCLRFPLRDSCIGMINRIVKNTIYRLRALTGKFGEIIDAQLKTEFTTVNYFR